MRSNKRLTNGLGNSMLPESNVIRQNMCDGCQWRHLYVIIHQQDIVASLGLEMKQKPLRKFWLLKGDLSFRNIVYVVHHQSVYIHTSFKLVHCLNGSQKYGFSKSSGIVCMYLQKPCGEAAWQATLRKQWYDKPSTNLSNKIGMGKSLI